MLLLRTYCPITGKVARSEVQGKGVQDGRACLTCACRSRCYAIHVANQSVRVSHSDSGSNSARHAPGARVEDSSVEADALVAAELVLARRACEGDEAAFEQIFRTYYARLVSFACTKVGSQALAEEMVQEVFLQIWTRREQWVVERSLAAYMFRAVRNRVLNARRSLRLETSYAAAAAVEIEVETSDPSDGRICDAEIGVALAHALAVLPQRPRQVFLLSRRQGLSYAEIADVLGIAVKTVEMHMGRALTQLRISLREWRRR